MRLEELVQEFADELPQIIADEARWVAEQFRKRTPAHLARTRSGIYFLTHGTRATVGIRFAKQYAGITPTHRRLQTQWQQLRPLVRQRIISKLNDLLKGE